MALIAPLKQTAVRVGMQSTLRRRAARHGWTACRWRWPELRAFAGRVALTVGRTGGSRPLLVSCPARLSEPEARPRRALAAQAR